ncbi:hypothetical protein J6590_032250 [Homalodisca vitripennis]|nr:hypothetical protein J6590_032250 [Homalodisca vitripennis]
MYEPGNETVFPLPTGMFSNCPTTQVGLLQNLVSNWANNCYVDRPRDKETQWPKLPCEKSTLLTSWAGHSDLSDSKQWATYD